MKEIISAYGSSIGRLNMLLAICGVMLTISLQALTFQWEPHILTMFRIFSFLLICSTAICIIGLFRARNIPSFINPNSEELKNKTLYADILQFEMEQKKAIMAMHMGANREVWLFIKATSIILMIALLVMALTIIQMVID